MLACYTFARATLHNSCEQMWVPSIQPRKNSNTVHLKENTKKLHRNEDISIIEVTKLGCKDSKAKVCTFLQLSPQKEIPSSWPTDAPVFSDAHKEWTEKENWNENWWWIVNQIKTKHNHLSMFTDIHNFALISKFPPANMSTKVLNIFFFCFWKKGPFWHLISSLRPNFETTTCFSSLKSTFFWSLILSQFLHPKL